MSKYTATHPVQANKITDISRRGASVLITFAGDETLVLPPSFLEKHDPQRGDFLVEYETGHLDCMAPSDFDLLFAAAALEIEAQDARDNLPQDRISQEDLDKFASGELTFDAAAADDDDDADDQPLIGDEA
tara:strand:+ start:659 stop:1051 length:393 start_codon:yes stop_codon:yes gene_type:complete